VVCATHPVGLPAGPDVGVVQEAVEDADGGGVLGQETTPLKGQCEAMASGRRS